MEEKYIAIKVKGLSFWLWFEFENTRTEKGMFYGTDGHGKNGGMINIAIPENEIIGKLHSEDLSYAR